MTRGTPFQGVAWRSARGLVALSCRVFRALSCPAQRDPTLTPRFRSA